MAAVCRTLLENGYGTGLLPHVAAVVPAVIDATADPPAAANDVFRWQVFCAHVSHALKPADVLRLPYCQKVVRIYLGGDMKPHEKAGSHVNFGYSYKKER